MLLSSKGIVFHTLKYGDTSLIARIYTREAGLLSFLIKGARTQKGAIRPSHLMPLNLLEMVFSLRRNSSLQSLRELKCEPVLFELHVEPVKRSITLFISELLNRSIREEEKNTDLFDFLSGSLQILDLQKSGLQLYPHYFCLQLTRYLGFFPDLSYKEGDCLDLGEGCFVAPGAVSPHYLSPRESHWVYVLITDTFENASRLAITSVERRNLLEGILRYYRLHFDHFRDLRSHEILRDVLAV
ncbi:MAG: DNA repair protein RecO [Bacteroidia bacterium]